jgi:hypothetical protein
MGKSEIQISEFSALEPKPSTFTLILSSNCDTPGVSFVLCREIYPNLECSVKISISRSCMSLIIQIIHSHFTKFGVIQSRRRSILEPVKTFILGGNANSLVDLDL